MVNIIKSSCLNCVIDRTKENASDKTNGLNEEMGVSCSKKEVMFTHRERHCWMKLLGGNGHSSGAPVR